ncbi:class I SAM-dependent methyltransferase [Actinoplanes sp. NEAU-A12]|uniref:Class I SAM-dependent methyltransferase n=1 Tax=Actinoplanes sandaracinus TaxID=3045177 RepID=A0ABT6WEX6_9ACTN|nr:class I SAM-dependent methyltransferase [Actinoplanes sandaracinus]MDI6098253.1 class I SAM-dependent methyltransferase [Actinoplanes sandaracinus]
MTTRERAQIFGELAEEYDRIRPGYPAELVTDILSLAGPGPVLEVGAGTGKATALFAAHDIDLTCLEPDPRMAAVLRRTVPGVPVIESTFEDWTPGRGHGLLVSAQAWHWVDAARRHELAFAALAPGGLLAPFWNVFLLPDQTLYTALAEVDARHGLVGNHTPHSMRPDDLPAEPVPFAEQWPELTGIEDLFTDLRTLSYRSARSYPSAEYRAHLNSISIYRMLDDELRETVLDDTIAVLDAHGGTIDFAVHTYVALARRPV